MATWMFSCAGTYGVTHQHDERISAPSHPCWNHLVTHTYHFGSTFKVTKVYGTLVFGPSEGAWVTITCQLSTNGTSWTSVGSLYKYASTTGMAFDFSVASVNAAHMRFIATGGYVDGSSGTVVYVNTKQITGLTATILNDDVKLNWGYTAGDDITDVRISKSLDGTNYNIFLNTVSQSTTDYTDSYNLQPFFRQYYKLECRLNGSVISTSLINILYPCPQVPILDISQQGSIIKIDISYETEATPANYVEIYEKSYDDGIFLIGTVLKGVDVYYYDNPANGNIEFFARSIGTNTHYSDFSSGSIVNDYYPQIEFGLGGDIMRHAIFTTHNDSIDANNKIIVNVWKKEEPAESTAINSDVVLSGDKKISVKNLMSQTDNNYDIGSMDYFWRLIFSNKTESSDTNLAKLSLWNGR